MNNRGRSHIKRRTIKYFTDELGRTVDGKSVVFPKPETEDLATFNKLAVKVFLSHTWSDLRIHFPSLPLFVNVIADIEMMYRMNYPSVHLDTNEFRGVETVDDFVQFAQQLVQKQLVQKINTSSEEPSAHMKSGDLSAVELVGLPTPPGLEFQRLLLPPNLDVNPLFDPHHTVNKAAQRIGSEMTSKYPGFKVKFHESKPHSEAFMKAENELEMSLEHGIDLSISDVWTLVKPIFQDNTRVTIQAKINDDSDVPFAFIGAFMSEWKADLSKEDKQLFDELMNDLLMNIQKSGHLQAIIAFTYAHILKKIPMDIMIEGDVNPTSGEFMAKAVMYIVDDGLSRQDVNHINSILKVKGSPMHTFMGEGVHDILFQDPSPPVSFVGSSTEEHEEAIQQAVEKLGMAIDFNGDFDSSQKEDVLEQAETIRKAIFGEGDTLLDNGKFIAAVFLTLQSVEENSGVYDDVSMFFADMIHVRSELSRKGTYDGYRLEEKANVIRNAKEKELGELLQNVDKLYDELENTNAPVQLGSFQESKVNRLKAEVLKSLQVALHQQLSDKMMIYLLDNVTGFSEFHKQLVNDKNNERVKGAIAKARLMTEKMEFPNIIGARYGREVQRRGHSDWRPLGGLAGAKATYWWFLSLVGDYVDDTAGENKNAKEEYFDSFEAVLLGNYEKDIHGLTFQNVLDMANDVAFAYEVIVPRSVENYFHYRHEQYILTTAVVYVFTVFMTRLWFSSPDSDKNKSPRARMGRHMLAFILGVLTIFPMAVAYALLALTMGLGQVLGENMGHTVAEGLGGATLYILRPAGLLKDVWTGIKPFFRGEPVVDEDYIRESVRPGPPPGNNQGRPPPGNNQGRGAREQRNLDSDLGPKWNISRNTQGS